MPLDMTRNLFKRTRFQYKDNSFRKTLETLFSTMYEMYARCMKSVRLMHLLHSVVRFIHPPVKRLSDSVF